MRSGVRRPASGVRNSILLVLALVLVLVGERSSWADTKVDWGTGLVTADGLGLADRHAPSPAVARGTSRRPAEDAARRELEKKVMTLPVAGGGTVAERARDKAVKARLDSAIADAFAVAAEPETDGAWRVTMAVPVEAVRQAIDGPRVLPATGDAGPAVVVIDGVSGKPAVGWKIGALEAATVWVAAPPAYAKAALHVHAKRAKAGVIEIDPEQGTASTLFVIVQP